eukprot:CCRYP_012816-RA/>CCRYP_012816-RA protein AED:0.00 eAED:0.00 QI:1/1/1/1/0/0/2/41/61
MHISEIPYLILCSTLPSVVPFLFLNGCFEVIARSSPQTSSGFVCIGIEFSEGISLASGDRI